MILDNVPSKVVAIYAHPDDVEIACGATLAKWAANDAEIFAVVCARGEKGGDNPNPCHRTRRKEVVEAAEILGVKGVEFLDYPDWEVENTLEFRKRLVKIIRQYKPEVIFCPDPTAIFFGEYYYNHLDHRNTGWATLDACFPAAGSKSYYPELGEAHKVNFVMLSGTLEPNCWVDVSGYLNLKVLALTRHQTVVGEDTFWVKEQVELRARSEGMKCGVDFAEGFRRIEAIS